MNIKWNEVTWYSKLLSFVFLIGGLPLLTFYLGIKYEEIIAVDYPAVQFTTEALNNSFLSERAPLILKEKDGWSLYKNYGFQIEFPDYFGIPEDRMNGSDNRTIVFSFTPKNSDYPVQLYINIYKTKATQSVGGKDVLINGVHFQKQDVQGDYGGTEMLAKATQYYAVYKYVGYSLTAVETFNKYTHAGEKESSPFDSVLQKMIDGFKFKD